MKFLYIEFILAIFISFVYCDCNSFKTSFNDDELNDVIENCVENGGDITTLAINSEELNEEVLQKISSLVSLEQLTITTSQTELDITPLNKLEKLVELTINGSYDISNKLKNKFNKSCFSSFINLKKLIILDYVLSQDVLNDLAALDKLEYLKYTGMVAPEFVEAVGSLTSLKTLDVYVRVSDMEIDLSPLHKLENLEKIEFECRVHKVRNTNYGFADNSFGGLDHLKTMKLYGFSFANYTNEDISNMAAIEEIEFNRCNYKEASSFAPLEKLNDHIKSLLFSGYHYFKSAALYDFPEITSLTNLKKLTVDVTYITTMPEEIGNLTSLEYFSSMYNDFTEVPTSLTNLKNLKYLDLSSNSLTALPTGLSNMKNLEHFDISNNEIAELPVDFNQLTKLQYLAITDNDGVVPGISVLKNLKNLKTLYISDLGLTEYPSWLKSLTKLEYLDLSYNEIVNIDKSIGNLVNLKTLNLNNNLISELPSNIKKLNKLIDLYVGYNNVTSIPSSIKNLKNIVEINFDNNGIQVIPDFISNLKNLKIISLDNNKIKEIPANFSKLVNLEELYLSYNEISEIPDIFKNMKNIKAIEIRSNVFTAYPLSICDIENKSDFSFDIAYNSIQEPVPECYSNIYLLNSYQ